MAEGPSKPNIAIDSPLHPPDSIQSNVFPIEPSIYDTHNYRWLAQKILSAAYGRHAGAVRCGGLVRSAALDLSPRQGNGAGSLIGRCAGAIAACYALDTYNSPSDTPDYAIASLRRNSCSRLIAQEDMCTQLTPRALAGRATPASEPAITRPMAARSIGLWCSCAGAARSRACGCAQAAEARVPDRM